MLYCYIVYNISIDRNILCVYTDRQKSESAKFLLCDVESVRVAYTLCTKNIRMFTCTFFVLTRCSIFENVSRSRTERELMTNRIGRSVELLEYSQMSISSFDISNRVLHRVRNDLKAKRNKSAKVQEQHEQTRDFNINLFAQYLCF